MGGTGGGDLSGGGYLFDVGGGGAVVGGGWPGVPEGRMAAKSRKKSQKGAEEGPEGMAAIRSSLKLRRTGETQKVVRKRGEPDCLMSAGAGS